MERIGEGILIDRNIGAKTKQRIAIATVIISGKQQEPNMNTSKKSYAQGVAFGTRSKKIYAKRHGYDFIMATQKLDTCYGIKQIRPLECAWTKLALISRILKDYDWVFYTDADSVILNFDIKLERFLKQKYDMVICAQKNGFSPEPYVAKSSSCGTLNTGQVFYKNSDFTKFLIREAWKRQGVKSTPLSFEQSRIRKVLNLMLEEEQKRVLIYPAKAFNCHLGNYNKGDFMLHLYGWYGEGLYNQFENLEKRYGKIIDKEENKLKVVK